MTVRVDALPELVDAWTALESALESDGIAIAIADFGGYRTEADTAQILQFKADDYAAYAARERRAGRVPVPITGPWENGNARPIAPYGASMHNYGAARDFTIVRRPAGLSEADAIRRVQDAAESIGFRSGRSFGDDRHLELPISLPDAAARWEAYHAAASTESDLTPIFVILALSVGVFVAAKYARGLKSWS